MPRHKRPWEVAKLVGADKKDPQRYRKKPPKNKNPLGAAPAHLTPAAKKVWSELKKNSVPGVLTAGDSLLFEITANLMAQYRENPKEYPAARIERLVSCLGRLGMSPSDRQKFGMPADDGKSNPFDKF